MTVRNSYTQRCAAVQSVIDPRLHRSCFAAEKLLEENVSKTGLSYFKKRNIDSDFDVLIDFDKKSYTLLKTGDLKDEGTEKKICTATKIRFGQKDKEEGEFIATATSMVRILAKPGITLTERELGYEQKYGQIEDRMIYHDKEGRNRVLYLKEAYEHPAFFYVLNDEAKLPPCEIVSTLLPVAKKLKEMHADGVFHRDVKGLNILCKHNEKENDSALLIDFGLSASAKNSDEAKLLTNVYGTPIYTSPERFPGSLFPTADVEIQHKADDMFALGCVLYELIFERPIPWKECVDKWFKDKKITPYMNIIEELSKIKMQTLGQRSGHASSTLEECLHKLLAMDPKSRMTAEELVDKLSSIKENSTKFEVSFKRLVNLKLKEL